MGYKFGKSNPEIIGCVQAYIIKELLGTKIAECNDDEYEHSNIASQKKLGSNINLNHTT